MNKLSQYLFDFISNILEQLVLKVLRSVLEVNIDLNSELISFASWPTERYVTSRYRFTIHDIVSSVFILEIKTGRFYHPRIKTETKEMRI